jgi:hypothetical protein
MSLFQMRLAGIKPPMLFAVVAPADAARFHRSKFAILSKA